MRIARRYLVGGRVQGVGFRYFTADTAAREGIALEDVSRRIAAQIPMRRLGEPHAFAALAAFLASEPAAYITGQSIAVDGGWIRSLL